MNRFLHQTIAALSILLCTAVPQVCSASGMNNEPSAASTGSLSETARSASGGESLFPVIACGTAPTEWVGNSSAASSAILLDLAMADFTGDGHADLATVKLDRADSSNAHYVIEIRLTEGGGQVLRLAASPADLFITAKDVTGDGTLDIVVRAVGFQAPVAVFVNDGCGHFSANESGRFAQAVRGVPTESKFMTEPCSCRSVVAAAPGSYTIDCDGASRRFHDEQQDSLLPTNDWAAFQSFSHFGSNRAPPAIA